MSGKLRKYSGKRHRLHTFFDGVVSLLYPDSCVMCGELSGGGAFCESCRRHYEDAINAGCDVCGNAFSKCTCQTELGKNARLVYTSLYHRGTEGTAIGSLIHSVKKGTRCSVKAAAREMAKALSDLPDIEKYTVSFIPRSKEGIRRDGCDHAKLLAYETADILKLNVMHLLRRVKSKEQKKLSRSERFINAKKSYEALDISPEYVILVDDITTTGATFKACSSILKVNGAKRVICLAMAKTDSSYMSQYENLIDDI